MQIDRASTQNEQSSMMSGWPQTGERFLHTNKATVVADKTLPAWRCQWSWSAACTSADTCEHSTIIGRAMCLASTHAFGIEPILESMCACVPRQRQCGSTTPDAAMPCATRICNLFLALRTKHHQTLCLMNTGDRQRMFTKADGLTWDCCTASATQSVCHTDGMS